MSDAPDDEAPTTRIEVTGGGQVSADELAALVVALTPVATAHQDDDAVRTPAWARAALLENVGLRRIAGPADLTQPGSRL